MKKQFAAAVCMLGMAAVAGAAQNPPQPPTPPQGVGPLRGDARHHDVQAFAMRMGGADESARILPPGAWWKDAELAKRIELTSDQQKRIEDYFLQSKITLIHMHATLEEQELLLAPLLEANPLDQGKVLAQIGKIADTRADLEKANAKMLLQVRGVLSQQQWTKLQQERPGGMRHIFIRTPEGPHSFNWQVPDADAFRMHLQSMPKVDVEKLRLQTTAMLQSMPQLDGERLRLEIQAALKNMPAIDVDKLQPEVQIAPLVPVPVE